MQIDDYSSRQKMCRRRYVAPPGTIDYWPPETFMVLWLANSALGPKPAKCFSISYHGNKKAEETKALSFTSVELDDFLFMRARQFLNETSYSYDCLRFLRPASPWMIRFWPSTKITPPSFISAAPLRRSLGSPCSAPRYLHQSGSPTTLYSRDDLSRW